jgi:hypothetical protein
VEAVDMLNRLLDWCVAIALGMLLAWSAVQGWSA